MKIRTLKQMFAGLNDEADVVVALNGTCFDLVNGAGVESHDNAHAPRIVLQLGPAYRYRTEGSPTP